MAGGDGKDKKPEVVTEYKFAQGYIAHCLPPTPGHSITMPGLTALYPCITRLG